jgi:signal transduction histidine kinase/PAS domain-containing protein
MMPNRLHGGPDATAAEWPRHDASPSDNGTPAPTGPTRKSAGVAASTVSRLQHQLDEERRALRALNESHERLRIAVESSDIGTFDFNPITGAVIASASCKAILGLEPNADVDYDVFLERVHPDDRLRAHEGISRALSGDASGRYDLEVRVCTGEGTVRSMVAKGRVFFEGDGPDRHAVRFIGTAIDVTARRQAESFARLLAAASTLLASSLDTEVMLAGVARLAVQSFASFVFFDMLDDNGTMIRSAAVHRHTSRLDLMQRARNRGPDLERSDPDDPIATAVREQRVVMRHHLAGADGRFASAPVQDPLMRALDTASQITVPLVARGRALGVVTFARSSPLALFGDEEREIAEELARRTATAIDNAQLYRAAVAANDAKSTFLASMSHELRTPLTAIIGYEELLADGITGSVTDSQRQQLGRIKASATHLLGLIDEILTFSRVEAGSESANMDVVEVCTVLEDAAALVAPLVDDRGLALTLDLPDREQCICTDPQKLRQILVNLLSNATKFTERGGITLSASRAHRQILFQVRDTGIGIPPQHLQQIFEPFWQVDQRANRRVGGTGLGLTVSRRLAQLIGGDLSVDSRVGAGTTFTLQLPALD